MLFVLFVVLGVLWVLGWLVFHVAGSLIHLLLLVAVVSLILHFVRGREVYGDPEVARPSGARAAAEGEIVRRWRAGE